MDIDLGEPLVLCHLQKGEEVIQVGVDTAVGQKGPSGAGRFPFSRQASMACTYASLWKKVPSVMDLVIRGRS